jgi:ribonuclease D
MELNQNEKFPIVFVDQDKDLEIAAHAMSSSELLSLDTEYDSFKRKYGFNLLLLQVFDQRNVYIIDPLKISNFKPLWNVFENEKIVKVLYSGSEDIALLKQHGCDIKNIFDVQIAATLCNHPARNLGDLLLAETGIDLDKSEQTSDWSERPLSDAQLNYAANDVVYLPHLCEKFSPIIESRDLSSVLEQENKALELISERTHIPKLKPSYYKDFSKSFCDALLAALQWRDEIGKDLNIPPNRVVDQKYLEDALLNHEDFISQNEFRSFHPKVRFNQTRKDRFIEILKGFDPTNEEMYPRLGTRKRTVYSKEERLQMVEDIYNPVKTDFLEKYGERTTEFLLRGMKRMLTSGVAEDDNLLQYRKDIFKALSDKIGE